MLDLKLGCNLKKEVSASPDFRILFESVPGLYLVLTKTLEIVAVSDAYLAATMTRRETILGKNLFEVFPDNPDDPNATGVRNLHDSLRRVLQTKVPDTMAVQKYDIRRPESQGGGFEERYWSPRNSPVLDPQEEILYIIHRVEDVTDFVRLKQKGIEQNKLTEELRDRVEKTEGEIYIRAQELQEANRQLRTANEELERREVELKQIYERLYEMNELKTQFFANISHELRTPLTLILGPTSKLLSEGRGTPAERYSLEVILQNAMILLKHVNDLLDVAKMEAGKMVPNFSEIDLAKLVRLTGSHFESLATDRRVAYSVNTPETLQAQVDPEKMQRIILNLLSNAFKFAPHNGIVRCELTTIDGDAILSVVDSGPGVPPEFREIIFERFRQGEGGSTRTTGGTGLGLAIAKDFVGLHRGTIHVSTAPEGGALFVARFPLKAPQQAAIHDQGNSSYSSLMPQAILYELQTVESSQPEEAQDSTKPSVLVVEDNREMIRFIAETLSDEFHVGLAYDGKEGLEKSLSMRPDLILTDVMMPKISGDQLVSEIRKKPQLTGIPIVLLTAKADLDFRVKVLVSGAQDFILKPFSTEELLARVRNLVALKRTMDELKRKTLALESSNKELESFAYSVSHDLRAPLRAIDGFSRMLLKDSSSILSLEGKRFLDIVRANTQKMGQLIDDLLTLSRLGRLETRSDDIDMDQLVKEVLEELERDQYIKKNEVTVHALPRIRGDSAMLRQILVNLIFNAVKFSRKSEPRIIEIGSRAEEDEIVYWVKDNGVGFDMKYADKLFGVFQRLHSIQEFEGTGVGLAIAHRIVQKHDGRIWAEAKVDEGATFYFALPFSEKEND
ncbi:ATP-binding protein [bacterium]|nr:ATP-binding protein [bacterium]